ncbi:MAG: formylglycine-generating enzyme family protein, partial [Gammaproteobacteria bacterium]
DLNSLGSWRRYRPARRCRTHFRPVPIRGASRSIRDKANAESTISETSAVGCYPTGYSPYGCEDMSGNVWEWTRSLWGKDVMRPDFKYPYEPLDGKREGLNAGDDVWRVVRGGAWYDDRYFARCAYRYWARPDSRYGEFGFRVVLRFAPVS